MIKSTTLTTNILLSINIVSHDRKIKHTHIASLKGTYFRLNSVCNEIYVVSKMYILKNCTAFLSNKTVATFTY